MTDRFHNRVCVVCRILVNVGKESRAAALKSDVSQHTLDSEEKVILFFLELMIFMYIHARRHPITLSSEKYLIVETQIEVFKFSITRHSHQEYFKMHNDIVMGLTE